MYDINLKALCVYDGSPGFGSNIISATFHK